MALSVVSSNGLAVPETRRGGETFNYRNDAFSFWKLPESCRAPLEQAIEASEPLIRRYLFEEYMAPHKRLPSSTVMAYYRVKRFIPMALRHWINYTAVRTRLRDVFPNWPCETALVDLWRQWLQSSLNSIGQPDPWHIAFWPFGRKCCISLTHANVDSPVGFARMERMAVLEERYGFKSSRKIQAGAVSDRLEDRGAAAHARFRVWSAWSGARRPNVSQPSRFRGLQDAG